MKRRTAKDNVINPHVTVEAFHALSDASGAPAVLVYRGFRFAFDALGEVKCNLVGTPSGASRTASKIARDVCSGAYHTLLEQHVTEEWREANIRMYDQP